MEGVSEKLIHREQRSAGDRKRKLVLNASASLLLLTFTFAIVFHSQFKRPWSIFVALLLPSVQTAFGLLDFDAIRASPLVERESITLQLLSLIMFAGTFVFTSLAEGPDKVSLMISCVYLVWGGMFDIGMGLATQFAPPQCYAIMASSFGGSMVKRGNSPMCAWLCVIPVSLAIGMIALRHASVKM